MKELLGNLRRADQDFHMIAPGDRVAVGVSGGKDSLALLEALALYRRFSPNPFELAAVTLHMGYEPFDTAPIAAMCARLGVPFLLRRTEIFPIIFERRREPNPCSLCARMRRGALVDLCREEGFGKLALGHHREDVEETLLMSVLYEGRLRTFRPVTILEGSGVAQIRPLIYCSEKHIAHVARKLALPVVKSPCPADGATARQEMKELLAALCRSHPEARDRILSALRDTKQYGLWE